MKLPLLIVPGWQDSEPMHWQSLWERKFSADRVRQKDWIHPDREEYAASVPKVGILLAYFQLHPDAATSLENAARFIGDPQEFGVCRKRHATRATSCQC